MKLYFVKREVYASSLEEALKKRDGKVYQIEEASKEYQPEEKINPIGFSNGTQKSKKIKRPKSFKRTF